MMESKVKNAKVFIRIMPEAKMCWENVKVLSDKKSIYIRRLQDFQKGVESEEPLYWKFHTDGIFYNCMQQDIFERVLSLDVLKKIFEGEHCIIFSYGTTGSGKSLTISGLLNSYEDRGIAPRLLEALFDMKVELKDSYRCTIKMSYVETKKMYLVDLLNEEDNLHDMTSMKNITTIKVDNRKQAMKLLFKGEANREYVRNCPYYSHAANGVLTFYVYTKPAHSSDPTVQMAQVHVVDLSGADTVGNWSCFYKSIYQVGNANLAKTQLEQFLIVLIEHIPEVVLAKQRLNILVLYLKDALTSSSSLRFIGHVRTSREDLLLTLSMLRFAQIVRNLKPQPGKPSTMISGDISFRNLQEEIKMLEKERHLNAIFGDKEIQKNITGERIETLKNMIVEYIQNKLDEFEVCHFGDISTMMKIFKDMYNQLEAEKSTIIKDAYAKAYENFINNPPLMAIEKRVSTGSNKQARKSGSQISGKRSRKSDQRMSVTSQIQIPDTSDKKSLASKTSRASKTSVSKRKSLRSSGVFKRSSKVSENGLPKTESMDEDVQTVDIPEEMPEYEDAFRMFQVDETFNYDYLNQLLQESEDECRVAQRLYIAELKILQDLKTQVEKRQEEKIILQLQRDFFASSTVGLDMDSVVETPNTELIEQKEKVLKCQADLKITVNHYNDCKRNIQNAFDRFCSARFRTVLIGYDDVFEAVSKEILHIVVDYDEKIPIPEEPPNVILYKKLQRKLIEQIELKKNDRRKGVHKYKGLTCPP